MRAGGDWDQATFYGFLEELVQAVTSKARRLGSLSGVIYDGRDVLSAIKTL